MKNQTTHYEALPAPKESCPVDALVELVKYIRGHQATKSTFLCTYKDGKEWQHVSSNQITRAIKQVAIKSGLISKRFPASQLGSHSLRAGGAIALNLNGIYKMLIKKHGRWSSETFLTCIHEQIAGLVSVISAANTFLQRSRFNWLR